MLYAEVRRHLGKIGITLNDFDAHPYVGSASISNYSKLKVVPFVYVIIAILLGEAVDRGVNTPDVLRTFGVAPGAVPAESNVEPFDMFCTSRAPFTSEEWRKSGIDADLRLGEAKVPHREKRL